MAPKELAEMFHFVRSDRTRKLLIKSCNGQMGDRAITVCGPKLWNALSKELREEKDTEKFKKKLKTFLFDEADKFLETVYMS